MVKSVNYTRSFNQWGNTPKSGCVEFSFENSGWFVSKFKCWFLTLLVVFISAAHKFLEDTKFIIPGMCVLAGISTIIGVTILFSVKKETLYVIAPIGVQFITTYLVGKESVWFVPWHSLQNFVIVEVIVGQQIFFYLGLQSKSNNKEGLVILFQNTRPRLHILEDMYKEIVHIFLSKEKYKSMECI